jgi:competence protein ComEC
VIYPAASVVGPPNDLSYVVRIQAPGGSVLLPGDIELKAETRLLRDSPNDLVADIVVAPHHGSAISSSEPFVAQVGAKFVVFAAGYRNRFNFPRPRVVRRYLEHGGVTRTSGNDGAIEFLVSDRLHLPRVYRSTHRRYWHHRDFTEAKSGR